MDKLDVSFSGWDEDENTTKQSLEYPAFVPALNQGNTRTVYASR
jgi:hypothetical protein